MASEAQKAAMKRYYDRNKANYRVIGFRFNRREDADVLGKLDRVESKVGYIKRLVREDMERGQ